MGLLQTYADIFSGYSFRNSPSTDENQPLRILSLKDVNSRTGEIIYTDLSSTNEFTGSDKHNLREGDVLLISKGNDNRALLFRKDPSSLPVVASAAFIVIRPMPEYLNASYLTWYLNLSESQENLRNSQVGTTVNNLSIKSLREFAVKVPPLQKQQTIGEIYLSRRDELSLSREREEKWTQLLNEQLKSIL